MLTDDYHPYHWDGQVQGSTIIEPDEVQLTKVLGPDGKPYAIRRQKIKLGFALVPTKA